MSEDGDGSEAGPERPVWTARVEARGSRWARPLPGLPGARPLDVDLARLGLLQEDHVQAVALGAGWLVVFAGGALVLWDLAARRVVARAEVRGVCVALEVRPGGDEVLALFEGAPRGLLAWRPASGAVTWRAALGARLLADGRLAWVAPEGTLHVEGPEAPSPLALPGAAAQLRCMAAELAEGPPGVLGVVSSGNLPGHPAEGTPGLDWVDLATGEVLASARGRAGETRLVYVDPMPRLPQDVPARREAAWPEGWCVAQLWSALRAAAAGRRVAHVDLHPSPRLRVRAEGEVRGARLAGFAGYPWWTRLAWGPGGAGLTCASGRRVLVLEPTDLEGGAVRGEEPGTTPALGRAAWGADGTLALVDGEGQVHTRRGAEGASRRVAGGGALWGVGIAEGVVWAGAGRFAHRLENDGRGRRVRLVAGSRPPKLAALCPAGCRAAVRRGEDALEVRSLPGGEVERVLATPGAARGLWFLPGGRWLVGRCGGGPGGRWLAWDLAEEGTRRDLELPAEARWLAATTGAPGFLAEAPGRTLWLVGLEGVAPRALPHPGPRVTAAVAVPDGRHLALACGDLRLRVLDARTGACRETPLGTWPAEALAVSPDGRELVSGHRDGSAWCWDLAGWLAAGGPG